MWLFNHDRVKTGFKPVFTFIVFEKERKKKRDLLRKQQIPLFRYYQMDKLLTCGSHYCATTTNCHYHYL
jgi:hypothetical protein